MVSVLLRCRPSENEKEAVLVYLSAAQLLNLKIMPGACVEITKSNDGVSCHAVAWTARSDVKDGVIGISKQLQERTGIKLGNDVVVRVADFSIDPADLVPLEPVEGNTLSNLANWQGAASICLQDGAKYIAAGQVLTVNAGRSRKEFVVLDQGGSIFKITDSTNARLVLRGQTMSMPKLVNHCEKAVNHSTFDNIGGLRSQIADLRSIIDDLLSPDDDVEHSSPRGVLLHGTAGVGKSLLRTALSSVVHWPHIVTWSMTDKIPACTGPMLIHVSILSKLTDAESKTIYKLFTESSFKFPCMIVGEIRDVNDLQSYLRSSTCFADEIEVPIPNAHDRLEILQVLHKGKYQQALLEQFASRTHGYTGGDLRRLLNTMRIHKRRTDMHTSQANGQEANSSVHAKAQNGTIPGTTSQIKQLESLPKQSSDDGAPDCSHTPSELADRITAIDLSAPRSDPDLDAFSYALNKIRPSALQSIILEKPSVRWTDIGGMTSVKQRLRDAVEWPLLYPTQLREYDIANKRGILLYGPPGCSKTLLVKALATESSYNFLAVKGPELISMYVGESERATREVFKRARQAAPCIIFFDEIDSIALVRNDAKSSELNVLTTLLNEMDGFEELRDVLVVAATNKPQAIDPALLRPGRFDNVVYVGLPDLDTRIAILEHRFSRFKFDQSLREETLIKELAEKMEGFSGAEVVAVTKEAAIKAFRHDFKSVGWEEMVEAIKEMPKSVTWNMVAEYERWNRSRLPG